MYEQLLIEADELEIETTEKPLPKRLKGLYGDNVIWINRNVRSYIERACALAEEIGHHHTSFGDILDQTSLINIKQELAARRWAYKRLVPLSKIVQAQKAGIRNKYEMAEFLGVTEDFLEKALARYKEIYGPFATFENYTIFFEPLGVLEMFE
ncbi:ImmA/IrrE family metallo-endopeptidase [Fredinandcohnia humi]